MILLESFLSSQWITQKLAVPLEDLLLFGGVCRRRSDRSLSREHHCCIVPFGDGDRPRTHTVLEFLLLFHDFFHSCLPQSIHHEIMCTSFLTYRCTREDSLTEEIRDV